MKKIIVARNRWHSSIDESSSELPSLWKQYTKEMFIERRQLSFYICTSRVYNFLMIKLWKRDSRQEISNRQASMLVSIKFVVLAKDPFMIVFFVI
jgi:hypothetical protein